MKKLAYLLALISISLSFLAGCKDDSTPPTITIIGDEHVRTQRSVTYLDAGATASDDNDESVYVISDYSTVNPKNPNTDIVGDYLITYTAQDRAANSSTAIRRVSVTHTQYQLNHNYNVNDQCLSDSSLNAIYVSGTVVDTNYLYVTFFTNIANFFSGTTSMETMGSSITIPKQKPDGAASPFEIEGSGSVLDSAGVTYKMFIHYTIRDTTGTLPTQTRYAQFVSF